MSNKNKEAKPINIKADAMSAKPYITIRGVQFSIGDDLDTIKYKWSELMNNRSNVVLGIGGHCNMEFIRSEQKVVLEFFMYSSKFMVITLKEVAYKQEFRLYVTNIEVDIFNFAFGVGSQFGFGSRDVIKVITNKAEEMRPISGVKNKEQLIEVIDLMSCIKYDGCRCLTSKVLMSKYSSEDMKNYVLTLGKKMTGDLRYAVLVEIEGKYKKANRLKIQAVKLIDCKNRLTIV